MHSMEKILKGLSSPRGCALLKGIKNVKEHHFTQFHKADEEVKVGCFPKLLKLPNRMADFQCFCLVNGLFGFA